MKLIHIYIKRHKSVTDLNISLGGIAICEVKADFLEITRRQETTDYYYDHHCSAIIGANGVGKSSVLSFLEGCYYPTISSGILIFQEESSNALHICLINVPNPQCNLDITSHNGYESFAKKHQINLVKINNVTDAQSRLGYEKKNRHRLIQERTLEGYTLNKRSRKKYFDNLLRYFRWTNDSNTLDDVGFEFKFFDSFEKTDLLIADNEVLSEAKENYLKARNHILNNRMNLHIDSDWLPHNNPLLDLNSAALIVDLTSDLKGDSKTRAISMLFYYFIQSIERFDYPIEKSLKKAIEALQFPENWEIFKFSSAKKTNIYKNINTDRMHEKLSYVIEALNDLYTHLQKASVNTNNKKTIIALVDDFYTVSELITLSNSLSHNILTNISWGWRGVSTGEMARAHLLSETYNCLIQTEAAEIIIVIDEVDLYLHPEWQRGFLDSYLSMLNRLKPYTKPQIILTTHSPIIVSDFLPEDIVSLQKMPNNDIIIRTSIGFGTNITNLFIDGMHVDSTFGEHSRKAIATLMEKAQHDSLSELDRALIERMGNKFVREYLLQK